MEENKKLMAFVSERVLCSMSNALHRFKNLPPTAVSSEVSPSAPLGLASLPRVTNDASQAACLREKRARVVHGRF